MIEELIKKMNPFSLGIPKESYTQDDVKRFLNEQEKLFTNYLGNAVKDKLETLDIEISKLKESEINLKETLEIKNKESEELNEKFEALTEEILPFRSENLKVKAKELLEGKVAKESEADVYGLIDFSEMNEENKGTFLEEKLNKIFEDKPYLKPLEEKDNGDESKLFSQTNKEEYEIESDSSNSFRFKN